MAPLQLSVVFSGQGGGVKDFKVGYGFCDDGISI